MIMSMNVVEMVKYAISQYSNRNTNCMAAKSWAEKCSVAWTWIEKKDQEEKMAAAEAKAEQRRQNMKLSMPSNKKLKAIKF